MVKQKRIEQCAQRCTLPVGSLIANPKIGHCCRSRPRRHECTLGHRQSTSHLAGFGHAQQPDGLAVKANNFDSVEANILLFAELNSCCCECLTKEYAHVGKFFGRRLVVQDYVHHAFLDSRL